MNSQSSTSQRSQASNNPAFVEVRTLDFHLQFWTMIMVDHLKLLRQKLACQEVGLIHEINLLLTAAEDVNLSNFSEFLEAVRRLKRFILAGLVTSNLEDRVKIDIVPTAISHMLNELDEAERVVVKGENLALTLSKELDVDLLAADDQSKAVYLHKLWLTDIVGHLNLIKMELDPLEKNIKHLTKEKKIRFERLLSKAKELLGYLDHGVYNFPSLQKLTGNTVVEGLLYLKFLQDVLELRDSNTILGILEPGFVDHMIREGAYYLITLGYNPAVLPDPLVRQVEL